MNEATIKNETFTLDAKSNLKEISSEGKPTDTISTVPILNRAQRRAQAKQQKKYSKIIQRYIQKHPETVKVDIDEKAINELEEDERIEKLINETFDSIYPTK